MSLRIKHVSGYSLFVGDPDALKPQPVPVQRQPQWPNAVAISLPAGILTFKYSPQVSYRKHRHAASQGSTLTGNGAKRHEPREGAKRHEPREGAKITAAGMVA